MTSEEYQKIYNALKPMANYYGLSEGEIERIIINAFSVGSIKTKQGIDEILKQIKF